MSRCSRNIEKSAVTAVQKYFLQTKCIDPFISSDDKEPEWDGHLYVYNNEKQSKDTLFGRIPVQIKGKLKKFHPQKVSFPVSVVSLKNFLRDGGVYFFVVTIAHNNTEKIFCTDLAPQRIKNILSKRKGDKSVNIEMLPISDDFQLVVRQLRDFYIDCQKQTSHVDSPVMSYEELLKMGYTELWFHKEGGSEKDLFDSLKKEPVYLYAKSPNGMVYPIGDCKFFLNIVPTKETVVKNIYVGDNLYFTQYFKEPTENGCKLVFSEFFNIELFDLGTDNLKITINFKPTAKTLSKKIVENKFVIDLLTEKSIRIENDIVHIPNIEGSTDEYEKNLSQWMRLDNILKKLGVHKDLDTEQLSETDIKTINILIKAVEYEDAPNLNLDKPIIYLRFANLFMMLHAEEHNGKKRIGSFFNTKVRISYKDEDNDDEYRITSPFTAIGEKGFLELDNIPYDMIIPSYKEAHVHNENIFLRANFDLLSILLAVDKITEKEYDKYNLTLNAAYNLANWILMNCPESDQMPMAMMVINKLQCVKRMRALTTDERNEIMKVIADNQVSGEFKAAAYLLLDNYEFYKFELSRLDEETRKAFQSFPIYHFDKSNVAWK